MPLYRTTFQSSWVRIWRGEGRRGRAKGALDARPGPAGGIRMDTPPPLPLWPQPHRAVLAGTLVDARGRPAQPAHLEHGDDGPQQGVKVLPVGDRVSRVCAEAEFAAKDVHPKDAGGEGRRWLKGLTRQLAARPPLLFSQQPRTMGMARVGPILQKGTLRLRGCQDSRPEKLIQPHSPGCCPPRRQASPVGSPGWAGLT